MLRITDIVEMRVPEMEKLSNMKGKVIVANHPSLLDFVCMTALVTTTIVSAVRWAFVYITDCTGCIG